MPIQAIIDADTANEIDDLYAIVYALHHPALEVVGLTSTHFRIHDEAPSDSVLASQHLNERLLDLCDKTHIPHPRGANQWMGKAWGGTEPVESPAVDFIIDTARSYSPDRKLTFIGMGAMTNLASAVKKAPEIIPHLDCHLMALWYDSVRGVWDKNEFNVRNDLNALDYLFNADGLELSIMTATTSKALRFDRESTFAALASLGALGACLKERWIDHAPSSERWVMWDLALVVAICEPGLVTSKRVLTPPENTQREVCVYDSICVEGMVRAFWNRFPKV